MKTRKCLLSVLSTLLILVCFLISVSAQTAEDSSKPAAISASGSSVRWDVAAPNSGSTLTVAAPDGRIFRSEFKAGVAPDFSLADKKGLPDGVYFYELRLSPMLSAAAKEKLAAARGKDDDPEAVRAARKREVPQGLVQSGSFSVMNGAIIVAGSSEEGQRHISKVSEVSSPEVSSNPRGNKTLQHHPLRVLSPDDVIPDDLIVQGSACVGLDCVNGEVFGFDTIRLKENNTRLQFKDTSAAGFPLNNWQIRANSSAAGGASFLAFVDQGAAGNSETGTINFEVDAGAPANSLKVASTGKVGLRTATPVLDVHANTTDTPAIRLEQNNSGGFTAQTWDIAGNEANFFIRDVTGGSRLPFRIRPGAPTSSIDVAASGNVTLGNAGTAGLSYRLRVQGNSGSTLHTLMTTSDYNGSVGSGLAFETGAASGNTNFRIYAFQGGGASTADIGIQPAGGRVGIGTNTPDQLLSVNGEASKAGGGNWAIFSDERLKKMNGRFNTGLKALMQLQPIRYEYLQNNALGINSKGEHIGFGAQSLQKVIPEAVTQNDQGYLLVKNDPIMWTMLNAIKEQQAQITAEQQTITELRRQNSAQNTRLRQQAARLDALERAISKSVRRSRRPRP